MGLIIKNTSVLHTSNYIITSFLEKSIEKGIDTVASSKKFKFLLTILRLACIITLINL